MAVEDECGAGRAHCNHYFVRRDGVGDPVEKSLIILKPDAVQRGLIGQIVSRMEDKGLLIVGMKMMQISTELAERHYAPHKGKPFYPGLIEYSLSITTKRLATISS